MWNHRGQSRPDFASPTAAGQESVWDYPRPPICEPIPRQVTVKLLDTVIASSKAAIRVLETASPPTFYLSPESLMVSLDDVPGTSFCEWKGQASYFAYADAKLAWRYDKPSARFAAIDGWYSFYASLADCYVDGEKVQAQQGDFYGGWITPEIVGPFKGDPGTLGW